MRVEILKGSGPTTLTKQWFEDGDVVEPTSVSYDLLDADGTSVDSGTASKAGSGATTTFTITVSVADASDVEEYDLVWTRDDTSATQTDRVSVVGSALFTEAEARAFSIVGGINPLTAGEYSDRQIAEARYRITDLLERRLGTSLIRRFARARLAGTGSDSLSLIDGEVTHGGDGAHRRPLSVVRASVNGTALTGAELSSVYLDRLRQRLVRYDGNSWSSPIGDQPPRNVVVSYEYGYDVVPWEANRVGLLLLLRSLVPSDVSSRATSITNADGTFRLSTPSLNFPTGIPEIDEFINAHDEKPLFA